MASSAPSPLEPLPTEPLTACVCAPAEPLSPLTRTPETARLRWFPASVTVEVLPGDARVVAGQPLTIRARLRTGERDLHRQQPQLIVEANGERRTVTMARAGDGFEFSQHRLANRRFGRQEQGALLAASGQHADHERRESKPRPGSAD